MNLTKYLYIIAVVAGLLGGMALKLHTVILERDLAQAKLLNLNSKIIEQNIAILHWKKQAETQSQRLEEAIKESQHIRKVYYKDANNILQQNVSSVCSSSIEWAIQMAGQLKN